MLFLINILLALWVSCAEGQERTCNSPEIKHGKLYGESQPKQIFPVAVGKCLYYTCDHSYVSTSQSLWTQTTCTEGGWSPTPKCRRLCFFPSVENGHSSSSGQIHIEGDTVQVLCDTGYILANYQSNITCTEDGWSSPPKCNHAGACVVSEEMMEKHHIQFKWRNAQKIYFRNDDTVEFSCKWGYKQKTAKQTFRATCREGKLEYPSCEYWFG